MLPSPNPNALFEGLPKRLFVGSLACLLLPAAMSIACDRWEMSLGERAVVLTLATVLPWLLLWSSFVGPAVRRTVQRAESRAAEAESTVCAAQLRQAEARRLSTVGRRNHAAAAVLDLEGRIEWSNAAFSSNADQCADELWGRSIMDLLTFEEGEDGASDDLGRALKARGSRSGVRWADRVETANSRARIDVDPIHDEAGDTVGFAVLETTNTNERRLADELACSSERLRTIVEGTNVCLWEFDPMTECFTYMSPQIEVLGYPQREWYEAGMLKRVVHPEDFQCMWDACSEATSRGQDHVLTYRMLNSLGEETWYRDIVRVSQREDGSLLLRGVLMDIDEEVRTEKKLAALSDDLRVEAERLEMAISAGRLAFWDWNVETGEVAHNGLWPETIGASSESYGTHVRDWLDRLHPEDRVRIIERCTEELEGEGDRLHANYRFRHADGSWIWAEGYGRIVSRDENGKPTRIVGIQRDRTREVERRQELERLRAEAEAASRSKSEFLANMSHEIRTPLTAILGFTEMLRESAEFEGGAERREEILGTIRAAGGHLLTIINDVLDLSKIEAEQMAIEEIEFDLPALLAEVSGLVRMSCDDKGVELRSLVEGAIPVLAVGDPTRLRQVLVNLVGNAAKFTEQGHVTLRAAAFGGERLVIEVEDTGPGMGEEAAEKLFRPFVQADGTVTRRYGGTGLGLAISRRLAHLMGGEVRLVETTLGVGSRFAFELPLRPAKGTTETTVIPESTGAPESGVNTDHALVGRILLVEDNPMNQRLVRRILTRAGAQVDVAGHGAEALEMLEEASLGEEGYALIVTDMQMPVMDGYSLARELRRRGEDLPIIALTAHAMSEDRDRCIEAGCDDYATKPIDRVDLIQTCARWIILAENRDVA